MLGEDQVNQRLSISYDQNWDTGCPGAQGSDHDVRQQYTRHLCIQR